MTETAVRTEGPVARPVLEAALYEAFCWNPEAPRPDFEELRRDPEFTKWIDGFGDRAGDVACVAERPNESDAPLALGAAWYRHWTAAHHSWGFVAEDIPELAIAVFADSRGQGIGRRLLSALIGRARGEGVRALSLSVDPANPARRLYESLGFERVGESGTSWTLLLELDRRASAGTTV